LKEIKIPTADLTKANSDYCFSSESNKIIYSTSKFVQNANIFESKIYIFDWQKDVSALNSKSI